MVMANGEMTLDVGRIVDVAVAASSRERTDAERARSNQIYGLQTHRHNALEKTVDCTATSTTLVHAEMNATFKRINTLNVCRIYSDVAVMCNENNARNRENDYGYSSLWIDNNNLCNR